VFGWLTRLFAAAVVASAVLIAPTAAFACNGGTSAVNVYKECLPSGGGGKPAKGSASQGSHRTGSSSKPRISKSAAKVLHTARRSDRRALQGLIEGAGPPLPKTTQTGSANAPTALGSAFDLGSGPTALLIVLGGTALLLLGGGGMRAWRGRNRL
jgi:hypothetical protein